jgi:glycosyltransferase involved in cell wall biosynthesis
MPAPREDAPPDVDVSVVVCTYDRCALLVDALASLLAQDAGRVRWELIVVDNNSRDDTPETVLRAMEPGGVEVRYLFEPRQGLCHARNAGIAAARAPVVAFTDDDVRVTPDWVRRIHRAFAAHPEVDFVGGRVLPRWPRTPPAWLTAEHWAPLAAMDLGDRRFRTSAARPVCLVGANLAFRREVFARVGPFSPEFQHPAGGNCCTDDHEMELRVWRAGGVGLYLPGLVVTADVQENRLDPAYHRRWHQGHGRMCARMGLAEATAPDGSLREPAAGEVTLYGAPAFLYRSLVEEGARWAGTTLLRRRARAFMHENRARHLAAYVGARYREHRDAHARSLPAEALNFTGAILRKKLGAFASRTPGAGSWTTSP